MIVSTQGQAITADGPKPISVPLPLTEEQAQAYGMTLNDPKISQRILSFVQSRFAAMEDMKRMENFKIARCRKLRDMSLQTYKVNNIYRRPYRSGTFDQMIDMWLDKFIENMPEISLKASTFRDKNAMEKAMGLQLSMENIEKETNVEKVKTMVFEDSLTSGWGIMHHRHNPKLGPKGNIEDVYRDPVCIYFDEAATELENCRDTIDREEMPWSTFKETWGKVLDISKVMPAALGEDGKIKYYTQQEIDDNKENVKYIARVYLYYNVELKVHWIIVNNQLIHAEEWDQELPYTIYYYKKRNDSIFGNGLIEKTAPEVFALDTLVELAFKNAKAKLQKQIVASGEVGFHTGLKQSPNGIWILPNLGNRNIKETFAEIELGGIPQEFFAMRSLFLDNLTNVARLDLRQLLSSPSHQETATRTKAKQESFEEPVRALMRRTVWDSERRRWTIRLKIFKDKIAPQNRDFLIEGFFVLRGDSDTPQFIKDSLGEGVFKATAKNTNVDVSVVVMNKRNAELEDEVETGRFMQYYQLTINAAATNPEIFNNVDMMGFVEEGAERFKMDKRRFLKDFKNRGTDAMRTDLQWIVYFQEQREVPNYDNPNDYVDRFLVFREFLAAASTLKGEEKLNPIVKTLLREHLTKIMEKGKMAGKNQEPQSNNPADNQDENLEEEVPPEEGGQVSQPDPKLKSAAGAAATSLG